MCIYVYMCVYVYIYMCVFVVYIRGYIHIYVYMCVYLCVYMCIYVKRYEYTYVYPFGANTTCYETHEIEREDPHPHLLRPPLPRLVNICVYMCIYVWEVLASWRRFAPKLPQNLPRGFGANTSCYETHELLVLGGFGVFRSVSGQMKINSRGPTSGHNVYVCMYE